jgi:5'-3' exonuclease
MSFEFQLGTPFRPYEQLMGVLPVASMEHIPLAYQVSLKNSFMSVGHTLSPFFVDRI